MSLEFGIRPTPRLKNIEHAKHVKEGVAVSIEQIPPNCIDEFVVNPQAGEFLPTSLSYLATHKFLRQSIYMTVPTMENQETIVVPRSYGRAIPLYYGRIPFHRSLGGHIMAKGCFLSGENFKRDPEIFLNTRCEPTGLFGAKDAKWEMDFGNDLISTGFRGTLTLGYGVFHEHILKEWLKKKYPGDAYQELIHNVFDIVRLSGDRVAYIFRVADTTERYEPFETASVLRQQAELSRGAQLMLDEYTGMNNSQIRHSIKQAQLESGDALDSLDALTRHQGLSGSMVLGYRNLLINIFSSNARGLARVMEVYEREGKQLINPIGISQPKDIGMAAITTDYEEARLFQNSRPYSNIKDYMDSIGVHISWMLKRELLPRVRDGYSSVWTAIQPSAIQSALREHYYHPRNI